MISVSSIKTSWSYAEFLGAKGLTVKPLANTVLSELVNNFNSPLCLY